MPYTRLLTTRNMTLFSIAALGTGYFTIKSKTLAEKQQVRPAGDYAVTVDRSGTFPHLMSKPLGSPVPEPSSYDMVSRT
ncbi:hypothetical protein CFE70_007951 [Pyrenophora teres f. teres 0-1]|nr:hypothetical protein PTMSG1_08363 [Pyrenophora teres f. maculata]